jgi:hypothetical protein
MDLFLGIYKLVVNTVISYLQQLIGSVDESDTATRALLYFMLSKGENLPSQKALLEALDGAVDDEEGRAVIVP